MKNYILRGKRWLVELVVLEFGSVGDLHSFHVLRNNGLATIVSKGHTHIPSMLASEIPRVPIPGFLVDNHFTTKRCMIVSTWTIEIFPRRYIGVQCGLTHNIERHLRLWK